MDISSSSVDHEAVEKVDSNDKQQSPEQNNDIENNPKNIELSLEKPKIDFVSTVQDEDVVLGVDEPGKDFDGNIDEDELLKDTDLDECRKDDTNAQNIKRSETSNQLNVDNTEENNIVSNKNISSQEFDLSSESSKNNQMKLVSNEKESTDLKTISSENAQDISDSNNKLLEVNKKSEENLAINSVQVNDTAEHIRSSGAAEDEINNSDCSKSCDGNSVLKNNENKSTTECSTEDLGLNIDDSMEATRMTENNQNNCSNRTDSPINNRISDDKENDNCRNKDMSVNKDSVTNDRNENNEDNGTKFLHVDQDSSRPDDTFDMMETGGEDPFAQTVDEAMETNESDEKNEYINKTEKCHTDSEVMDVEDISSTPTIEDTTLTESDVHNSKSSDIIESTQSIKQNEISSETNDTVATNKVVSQIAQRDGVTNDSEERVETEGTSNKKENTQINKTQDGEVCIVPDKVSKENNTSSEVKDMSKTANVTPSKFASNKSSKSKHKSKKVSSDESSDSELEIGDTKSVSRPKRSAAKKAESQIKVSITGIVHLYRIYSI
ncbi:putative uncharacterized protein DDB_G0293878, partial [Homalodisca vitripennis]|uniref:putative uncharacterized protein DDB_G0293878 n=1 Tax=Homalodisca vitripennis TaxID=197043 RepID=UPI001EEA707A